MAIPVPLIIDRQEQLSLFSRILSQRSKERIILISGAGGMGKTSLLRLFAQECADNEILHATVSFRSITTDPVEVMHSLINELGPERFNKFSKVVTSLYSELRFGDDQTSPNIAHIQRLASGYDADERRAHMSQLTDAFFTDVKEILKLTQPIVCFFDDFEVVGPLTQQWLSNSFLSRVHNIPGTSAVIAGRQIPKISQVWKSSIKLQRLDSIYKIEDWQDYIQRSKIDLSPEILQEVFKLADGHPLLMATVMSQYGGKRGKE